MTNKEVAEYYSKLPPEELAVICLNNPDIGFAESLQDMFIVDHDTVAEYDSLDEDQVNDLLGKLAVTTTW